MAFNGGIKTQKFNSNSNGNNTFKPREYDRLVTVEDYDTTKGYLIAVDEAGKRYEAFVNPEAVRKEDARLAAKGKQDMASVNNWMGHSIDENMKKAIPPGSKVVLLRSKILKNDATRGLAITEVNRIGGVPCPEPNKTFKGIFTVKSITDEGIQRISHAQHWHPNAIDINDEKTIMDLKEQIDKAASSYQKKIGEFKVTEPSYGIQFRALIKTDREYEFEQDPSKKAIYEAVDTSQPFDYIPGPEDENGKQIKEQAHLISGDEMLSLVEGYVDYITNNENFKDQLDNMKIEICVYQVYPASKNSFLAITKGDAEKDKYAHFDPLYQLSHRKSYIDFDQTEMIIGKNAAVNGIILISADGVKKVNKELFEIPTNWVSKLHAHNTRGHVQSFIRTADGHKVEPHEKLALIKEEENTNTQNQGYSNSTRSNVNHSNDSQDEPATTTYKEPVASKMPEIPEDFDPFASVSEVNDVKPEVKEEVKAAPRFGGFGAKK